MTNRLLALANFICALLLVFGQYWAVFAFVGLALYLTVVGLGYNGTILVFSVMNFCSCGAIMVVSMVALSQPNVSHPETIAFTFPALVTSVVLLVSYLINDKDGSETDTTTLR